MKKILALLLAMALVMMCAWAMAQTYNNGAEGIYEYSINADNTATITDYTEGSDTDITIPAQIDGKKVTSIGDSAFCYCFTLTSVTIPDSVTSIGDSAFGFCFALTSVTIPDSVTSIGDYAFDNCVALTSVTIPDGVTSIGNCAFFYCEALTSVTIPGSMESIAPRAFGSCKSLTDVTISEGVRTIGDHAFRSCTMLKSVTIPSSVKRIGNFAFDSCWELGTMTFAGAVPPEMGDYLFDSCEKLTTIRVPMGSEETYREALEDQMRSFISMPGIRTEGWFMLLADCAVVGYDLPQTVVPAAPADMSKTSVDSRPARWIRMLAIAGAVITAVSE